MGSAQIRLRIVIWDQYGMQTDSFGISYKKKYPKQVFHL